MKRIVLFDIDGTLINGGKLWREVFDRALTQAFPGVDFPKVPFSGKTDRQICREMVSGAGLAQANQGRVDGQIEGQIDIMMKAYLTELREVLKTSRASEVEVLPGVREILDELSTHSNVMVALLTGNVKEGAYLKLGAVGLDHYFSWGAFGDDSEDRMDLPAIALKRAHFERGVQLSGDQLVVIGDTHHDVNCCKSVCAKSIAVGTGSKEYRSEIMNAKPHYFFETLESTDAIVQAIVSE